MSAIEDVLAELIAEKTGEVWPVTGYVLYAMTTDPETMSLEEPFWHVPERQREYVTRGLLEQARDELVADVTGTFSYVEVEDDDDDA